MTFESFKAKMLSDSEIKSYYEELAPEFEDIKEFSLTRAENMSPMYYHSDRKEILYFETDDSIESFSNCECESSNGIFLYSKKDNTVYWFSWADVTEFKLKK